MGGFEATQAPGRSLRQAAYLTAGMGIAHAAATAGLAQLLGHELQQRHGRPRMAAPARWSRSPHVHPAAFRYGESRLIRNRLKPPESVSA
jgi:hypothetical protein